MREILRRPKWMVLGVVVALIVAAFMSLGFWQLSRLEERRLNNVILTSRLERDPVTLSEVVASGLEGADLEYTRVQFKGTAQPDLAVFVRSQTNRSGEAGHHQIVPVSLDDGSHVLVNVGWVPLGDLPADVPGLGGEVSFTGFVRASQARQAFGQEEADGQLVEIRRVDLDRLSEQMPNPLVHVWVQLETPDDPNRLPQPVSPPAVDEGSHLAYALQWFSFAAISVVGFFLLVRREALRGAPARGSYVVDDDMDDDMEENQPTWSG